MKKLLSLMLVTTLLAGVMTACGSKTDADSTAADAGNAAAGSDQKVTLKIMDFKTEITDKIKAMASDYMSENPNVTIEMQVTGNYDTLLKTRFAANDGPDIFMTRPYADMEDWSDRLVDLSNEPWMDKVICD